MKVINQHQNLYVKVKGNMAAYFYVSLDDFIQFLIDNMLKILP